MHFALDLASAAGRRRPPSAPNTPATAPRRWRLVLLRRSLLLLACLVLAAACGRSAGRPDAAEFARRLPDGATIHELVFADLGGDGTDDALIAATVPAAGETVLAAFVFVGARGGRYEQALRRRLRGDEWLPVQIGRPGDGPSAAVFAARGGSAAALSYVVVQQRGRAPQVTLENAGLLLGRVRFVPEGLLESHGDTDRLFRWDGSIWQPEDLGYQYLPPLPAGTEKIEYWVDAVRGPMTSAPRTLQMRAGQHLFLLRADRGPPGRVSLVGAPATYTLAQDGVITLARPGEFEIHIEGPAYSGRTLVIAVRVVP
jgi:hypothetical protein